MVPVGAAADTKKLNVGDQILKVSLCVIYCANDYVMA